MSQEKSQKTSLAKRFAALLATIATVVGIIVGGLQIAERLEPTPTPTPQPTPPLTPSPQPTPSARPPFPEQIKGSYTLDSWTDLSQRGLGVQMTDGDLAITLDGPAVWKLTVEKTFAQDPGSLKVLAKGDVIPSREALEGDREHRCNKMQPSNDWGPIDPNLVLAVRGIDPNSGSIDAFSLTFYDNSSGDRILEMTNDQGMYKWKRKTGPLSTAPSSLLSDCGLLAPSD